MNIDTKNNFEEEDDFDIEEELYKCREEEHKEAMSQLSESVKKMNNVYNSLHFFVNLYEEFKRDNRHESYTDLERSEIEEIIYKLRKQGFTK